MFVTSLTLGITILGVGVALAMLAIEWDVNSVLLVLALVGTIGSKWIIDWKTAANTKKDLETVKAAAVELGKTTEIIKTDVNSNHTKLENRFNEALRVGEEKDQRLADTIAQHTKDSTAAAETLKRAELQITMLIAGKSATQYPTPISAPVPPASVEGIAAVKEDTEKIREKTDAIPDREKPSSA